jgi:hypothetical protein
VAVSPDLEKSKYIPTQKNSQATESGFFFGEKKNGLHLDKLCRRIWTNPNISSNKKNKPSSC